MVETNRCQPILMQTTNQCLSNQKQNVLPSAI